MATERRKKLVGPVICLRTFRTEDHKLDLDKQRRHLRWLLDQGIKEGNGVIMHAGGGSEGYFMNQDEWQASVDLLVEECQGRCPTLAGIFELSAVQAAEKAKYCADIGVDFIQVQPPHYMLPTNDEVFYHYQIINDAADVGIMVYNSPWAMPRPGYELTPPLFERLLELENVEGVKWSSYNMRNYVTTALLFADKLSFINNQPWFVFSMPAKLGMAGFINSDGCAAPRLVLHMWDLWQNERYDELDDFILEMYIEPYLQVHTPEELGWRGMGEGPWVRLKMEAMGVKMGPPFPAQLPMPQAAVEAFQEGYDKSSMAEWVDWQE